MARILVLGGYGVFGRRAAERLVRSGTVEVVIAGRDGAAAAEAARALAVAGGCAISSERMDATTLTAGDLARMGIGIVLNCAGPFQTCDYRVANAAIAAGVHYVDIADARGFVTGITALDAAAREAGVLVVSGASSVPALSAAVVDVLAPRFRCIENLVCGISPGNSFDPGVATVAAILDGVGRAHLSLRDGRMVPVHGWQPLDYHRFRAGDAGTRWLGHCDVPDLDLFPARYRSLRTQHFLAGVEVKGFHLGLWAISWLVRAGAIASASRLAPRLLAMKQRLAMFGSDRGAMFVSLAGLDENGRGIELDWELVARQGHGPYVPITPAVIVAKRLADGTLAERGARPCIDLMTLDDFTREVADLDIRHSIA